MAAPFPLTMDPDVAEVPVLVTQDEAVWFQCVPDALGWAVTGDGKRQDSAYSMSSSARVTIDGGKESPRDFAVLILMTSSNFTGCSIGNSAGFVPLSTFCT